MNPSPASSDVTITRRPRLALGDGARRGDVSGAIFRPISTVQDRITSHLRGEILEGRLAPGQRLRQAQLAQAYGVSLTPVREALRELAGEHLIDMRPNVGATVHRPHERELRDVYELRLVLMPIATTQAVDNISDSALQQARALNRELSDPTIAHADWVGVNRDLHWILDEAITNDQLRLTSHRLANLSQMYVESAIPRRPEGRRQATTEHDAILEAFERRDATTATDLTVAHFTSTYRIALRAFESTEGSRASKMEPRPPEHTADTA